VKVAVTTFGSEGDVRPYVALAQGLRHAGFDAYLVAAAPFSGRAAAAGVPFRDSGMRWDQEISRELFTRSLRMRSRFSQTRTFFHGCTPLLRPAISQTIDATADADLFVTHHLDICGYAAAVRHGRPRIAGCLMHQVLPTSVASPTGADLGAPLNRLLSSVLRRGFSAATDLGFREFMKAAGLPCKRHLLLDQTHSALLTLVGVSPALIPSDPSWRGRYHVTGFWYLDEPSFTPEDRLRTFIDAGEAPLLVSFGSMPSLDEKSARRAVVEALDGRRAVLQSRAAVDWGTLPGSILPVGEVAHDWLMPRVTCVVHHGGIGTVAAALRAGRPQVIVWHMADQPLWATLLHRRRLASKPISHHAMTSARLRRAIRQATEDEEFRQRAAQVAARIAREDGVANAVKAVLMAMADRRKMTM
jgi:sterol 3beta-glucosyltransferase